jgi:thiol:disulfide interchange protein
MLRQHLQQHSFAPHRLLHASSTVGPSPQRASRRFRLDELEKGTPMTAKIRKMLPLLLALILAALTLKPMPQAAAQIIDKVDKNLYSETANPTADIAAALARARREHKRVILDFGGNWCGDCQVLDIYYHRSPNAELLAKNFILVHVNIGHMDKNVEVAKKYNVPITKGVPALAVIDANGNLLYAQREKEFEHTSPEAITAFLNRWKPDNKASPRKL